MTWAASMRTAGVGWESESVSRRMNPVSCEMRSLAEGLPMTLFLTFLRVAREREPGGAIVMAGNGGRRHGGGDVPDHAMVN
jgi:hypothetical protein